jgi:stage III sporulation protein AB
MKQLSLLLIAVSFACAGMRISSSFSQRVKMLRSVCLFLSGIKTSVEFSLESGADIIERLAPVYSADLPFVALCREKLDEGSSFFDAWSCALSRKESTKALKKDDISLLMSFGKSFGTTDIDGQKSNCDIHIQLIKANLIKAENDVKLYRRPAAAIGVLCGAAVYILFM